MLVAALLGAANAYLGFKAGQTVSATFPAAVLAIAAFRLPFFRGTVLEQNTMRTAASVGEALVAGAIFTIPAFVMVNVDGQRLWTSFNYWETSLILLVGGVLGHSLHHPATPHAVRGRGTAVPREPRVRRDREGRTARRHRRALRVRCDGSRDADPAAQGRLRDPAVPRVGRCRQGVPRLGVHHFDSRRVPLGDVTHHGAIVWSTPTISPALIGVGYVIGFELSAINFAGGLLAWFVFVPLALFLNPELGARLADPSAHPAARRAGLQHLVQPDPSDRRRRDAGRRRLDALAHARLDRAGVPRRLPQGQRGREALRTERDLRASGVLLAIAALSVPVAVIYYHFSQSVTGAVVAAAVMMLTGFLFSAVGRLPRSVSWAAPTSRSRAWRCRP